jgi:hypothetical protein
MTFIDTAEQHLIEAMRLTSRAHLEAHLGEVFVELGSASTARDAAFYALRAEYGWPDGHPMLSYLDRFVESLTPPFLTDEGYTAQREMVERGGLREAIEKFSAVASLPIEYGASFFDESIMNPFGEMWAEYRAA